MGDAGLSTEELQRLTGQERHPEESERAYRYRMTYALAIGPRPVHSTLAAWLNTGDPNKAPHDLQEHFRADRPTQEEGDG